MRNDGLEASRFKARFASSQSNARTVSVKRGGSGKVVADLSLEYEPVKVCYRGEAVLESASMPDVCVPPLTFDCPSCRWHLV